MKEENRKIIQNVLIGCGTGCLLTAFIVCALVVWLVYSGCSFLNRVANDIEKQKAEFIDNYATSYNDIRKESGMIVFNEKIFELYKHSNGEFEWSKQFGDSENYPYLHQKYTKIKNGLIEYEREHFKSGEVFYLSSEYVIRSGKPFDIDHSDTYFEEELIKTFYFDKTGQKVIKKEFSCIDKKHFLEDDFITEKEAETILERWRHKAE
ncbi:hypothetical protein AAEX28_02520 [Lentisphaerota bacterium WC36G]|nr:hypothetical protein LJT99_05405 [Lentisphaerae bacterium WC36]